MALFSIRGLSVLAYAQGFTLWHYKAEDVPAQTLWADPDYFQSAKDMLAPGDQMHISGVHERKQWAALCFVDQDLRVQNMVCGVQK